MSTDGWIDKETVVHICNGVWLSQEKELTICNNMDRPKSYYAKWNKSGGEREVPYNFILCEIESINQSIKCQRETNS